MKTLRTMRYSHLAAEHLQQAVNHVNTVMGEWLEAIETRAIVIDTLWTPQPDVHAGASCKRLI